jgi:hypothetical protein
METRTLSDRSAAGPVTSSAADALTIRLLRSER